MLHFDCSTIQYGRLLRIFKLIATGFLTASECTKFVFDRGYYTGPHWGSLQRFPDPLAGLKGPTSKERERGKGEKKGG